MISLSIIDLAFILGGCAVVLFLVPALVRSEDEGYRTSHGRRLPPRPPRAPRPPWSS